MRPHIHTLAVLAALTVTLIYGCTRTDSPGNSTSVANRFPDSANIAQTWVRLGRLGAHDSLISITVPVFRQSLERHDTTTATWAAAFIAQSMLLDDNIDSAKLYIDFTEQMMRRRNLPLGLRGVISNTLGIHAMMSGLDYPKAIRYLIESYETSLEQGAVGNQIIQLVNIVNLFYMRSDIKGMVYARAALRTASAPDVSAYHKCISHTAMAQMYSVAGEKDSAWIHIDIVDRMADSGQYFSILPTNILMKADLEYRGGNINAADSLYSEALKYKDYTDHGTTALIYLRYGNMSVSAGDLDKAGELYRLGLEQSEKYRNLEFRMELLLKLSDLYHSKGDERTSITYYRQYRELSDNLPMSERELEFNNLLISYTEMEHEVEMQGKEIEVLQANRKTIITLFTAALCLISALFLWMRYRKQQEMYRKLVEQYQSHMQQTSKPHNNDSIQDRALWDRLEAVMQGQKVFRQKDLTLDKVAAMLGTNRTYLSKAVNTFSDCDFSTYVNKYRIRESIGIMQASGKQTAFKEIADKVGYNSLQAYYNAFQKETGLSPGKYREQMLRLQKTS